mmetsp:Transcript_11968/g.37440  ORF Transcript_11968/g.37440 Transcript_11968/m.37440 type:complete len:217 (-) Transcript_11968:1392-2042(-)
MVHPRQRLQVVALPEPRGPRGPGPLEGRRALGAGAAMVGVRHPPGLGGAEQAAPCLLDGRDVACAELPALQGTHAADCGTISHASAAAPQRVRAGLGDVADGGTPGEPSAGRHHRLPQAGPGNHGAAAAESTRRSRLPGPKRRQPQCCHASRCGRGGAQLPVAGDGAVPRQLQRGAGQCGQCSGPAQPGPDGLPGRGLGGLHAGPGGAHPSPGPQP